MNEHSTIAVHRACLLNGENMPIKGTLAAASWPVFLISPNTISG